MRCCPLLEVIRSPCTVPGKAQSARNPLWRFLTSHCPQILFELLEIAYNGFAVMQLISARRPDVIYERYFVFSVAAGLVARLRGCRVAYEVNDSSFLKQRVRGLALVPLARTIERRVLNRADLVVVISRAMGDILERNAGISPEKILVLPNAVHGSSVVDTVSAATVGAADGVTIGCVGFFVPGTA